MAVNAGMCVRELAVCDTVQFKSLDSCTGQWMYVFNFLSRAKMGPDVTKRHRPDVVFVLAKGGTIFILQNPKSVKNSAELRLEIPTKTIG